MVVGRLAMLGLVSAVHSAAIAEPSCGAAQEHTDQHGGKLLEGRSPNWLNTSSTDACCHLCFGLKGCTTWVREPTTGHCWLIAGGRPVPSVNRTVGFLAVPPPPPTAPPPPPPPTYPLPSAHPNVFLEAYGNDSVRIRITFEAAPSTNLPSAVMPLGKGRRLKLPLDRALAAGHTPSNTNTITNGNIEATVDGDQIVVKRVSDQALLFGSTNLSVAATEVADYFQWSLAVTSTADERFWGLGENMDGALNNKGTNLDFRSNQVNTMITIPFTVSSKRYGLFFNSAAWGGIDMSQNNTTVYSAIMSRQMDFVIMTHPAEAADAPYAPILSRYYDAIGHPPTLPDWALGFWASKERYSSQKEIVDVVTQYRAHNITVDVLVIDWKHYNCVGDWNFTLNPATCWPDPAAMVDALTQLGVQQVFVSLHPWSEVGSDTHSQMMEQGLCARGSDGAPISWGGWGLPTCTTAPGPAPRWLNQPETTGGDNCLYDVSNPAARSFLWNRLKASYFDRGVTSFWTDGTEPAGTPKGGLPYNASFYSVQDKGFTWPGASAFMYWPVWHSQTIYEGASAAGSDSTWSLARSAWAGSHLHKTVVWSGDISSTWDTLAKQVKAGLNMQLVYPYWNTDTAGFGGGDYQTMGELIVRWFQFSIFTGVVRMHGSRSPKQPSSIPFDQICDPTGAAGGPIEPWVYGPSNISTLGGVQAALSLRQQMLPYLKTQIGLLTTQGQPFNRPLWFDFPGDPLIQDTQDQFMFGPGYMVAPVLIQGATSRLVLFPASKAGSVTYTHYFDGTVYHPGHATVPIRSLDTFPLFKVAFTS